MKTEKSKRLKGSVLFTVVSVMSIMIIFMTATLAVAAAANKRARKTYSSAQSSYTARTAIDSILAAVGTDKDFSKAVRSLPLNGEMDIIVNVNTPSMGRVENAKIKFVGTKTVFDPDENVNTWVTRNLYNITADVTIGGETTRISTNILQDPPQGDGGGGGAAFLTWGGADVDNHTYAWGGTYVGMGKWGDKTWNTDLNYIKWYNQQNRLTVLEDKDYLTHEDYHLQNDMSFEAPVVINGNLSAANGASIYYTYNGSGINNPGVQIWGDLDIGDSCKFTLKMSTELNNYLKTNGCTFYTMPYVYVDGALKGSKIEPFGAKNMPLNLFCGSLEADGNSGQMNFYGDVYCMDSDKTSVIGGTGSHLYKWADSVGSGTVSYSSLGGNFYSNGSVNVKSALDIAGDMRIEGDLLINENLTVHGDLVVGGTIINNNKTLSVTGTIYNDKSGTFDESKKNELFEHVHEATSNELKEYMLKLNAEGKTIIRNAQIDRGGWVSPPNNPFYAIAKSSFLNDPGLNGRYTAVDDPDLGTIYDFNGKGLNFYTGQGDSTLDNYFVEPIWDMNSIINKKNNPAGIVDYWRRKGVTPEEIVTDAEMNAACIVSGAAYPGASSIAIYKAMDKSGGTIYPARAERETLLGLYWPVKGIEHRVVSAANVDPADYAAMQAVTYTKITPQITNITQSCTLEGEFNSTVTVNCGNDDIYIRLLNVEFMSPESVVDEKKVVANTARIDINETGSGKVYFVLEGKVKSNYDYKDEKSATKLIKTVWDWQTEFNLESIGNKPSSEGTIYKPEEGKRLPTETIDGQLHAVIKPDAQGFATLTGDWSDNNKAKIPEHGPEGKKKRDIYVIAPATGEIWITLDNVHLGNEEKIIVDDSAGGEVYFYVKGSCVLGERGGIVSKTLNDIFEDPNKKINIVSKKGDPVIDAAVQKNGYDVQEPLKIRIYSEKTNASLKLENEAMLTAYVTAIYLDMDMPTVKPNQNIMNSVIYDGQPLSTASPQQNLIGVIGMLNVRSCKAQNDWTLLYVTEEEGQGKNTVVDAEGAHAYEAVEYMAYAR